MYIQVQLTRVSCNLYFVLLSVTIKFADDLVIVSLLQDGEAGHIFVLDYFIESCNKSCLELLIITTTINCNSCGNSKYFLG